VIISSADTGAPLGPSGIAEASAFGGAAFDSAIHEGGNRA